MIMNPLNGVWSDTQIMQIITQQELQKLAKVLLKNLTLKTWNFQSKLETPQNREKKNPIGSGFGYEDKENHPIYVSNKCCQEKRVDLSLIGEGEKSTMFLSKISILSCMIIHYIVKENNFVVYML